jgi:hypothetical protein
MKVHAPVFTPPPLPAVAAPPPAAKEAAASASGQARETFDRSLDAKSQGRASTQAGNGSRTGRGDTAPRRAATAPPPASPAAPDPAALLAGNAPARNLDAPYVPGSLINIKA